MNDATPRLTGTTALGSVIVTFATLLLLLTTLLLIAITAQGRMATLGGTVLTSLFLNVVARVGLLITGIAVLLRSRHSQVVASVTLVSAVAAALLDFTSFLLDKVAPNAPREYRIGAACGTFVAITAIIFFTALTLIYLRTARVKAEFGSRSF